MVDVTAKPPTARIAQAMGFVKLPPRLIQAVQKGATPKGEVLGVARVAAILAAKRCWELIPLCHPIPLGAISVDFSLQEERIQIEATVKTTHTTGVEMEALTAVTVAALTIYDMLKGLEKGIELGPFYLVRKEGGKSGSWQRREREK